MKLRADHVAGAFFVAFGLLIIGMSFSLPFGNLAMPGAGFLPAIVAGLIILFGASLFLRAHESPTFREIDWDDGAHAAQILVFTSIAVSVYVWLGFIITVTMMMVALLVIIERKNFLLAVAYSAIITFGTYMLFTHALQTPLPGGLIGYF